MKKLILVIRKTWFVCIVLSGAAWAQGVRYDIPPILTPKGVPAANVQVILCAGSGAISGATCSPQTQSFSGITLATPCPQGFPVTLAAASVCQSISDALGNAGFWLAPGTYIYCLNGTNINGQCYNLTVPVGATSAGNGNLGSNSLTAGAVTASRLFKQCFVDGGVYATLSAAYSDTTNCQTIYLPPNYTETQVASLFHFSRSNVSIVCMGGTCVITNTAGWKVDPGTNHVFFGTDTPYGMNLNGTNGGGLSFSGYIGSGVAFQIGDGTASTFFVSLKNVHVDLTASAAGAIGLKWFRTQFASTDNYSCLMNANAQICSTTDGTGDFTGNVEMRNSFIGVGASGTNAIAFQVGPNTSQFKVSGGNIALIQAGTSVCFDANGGELWLETPNCNTGNTAITVENNGTQGRISGRIRIDSGVTNAANFGTGTLGSHVFCVNCSGSLPITDNGGALSFNTFYDPTSLWINFSHWSIQGTNNQFTIRDPINNKTPINIVPNGNMFLGNATNPLILDNGNRLFAPENSAPSGVASDDILWPDLTGHRWKMNNNNAGTVTVGTLPLYNSGGTEQLGTPHAIADTCTLGTNCAVTFSGSAAFTSATTYSCSCHDQSTPLNACGVNQTAGNAITITGTGTDVIRYACVGN